MYSRKDTQIKPLALDLAKEVASMPGFLGEREIRPARLKWLYAHLKDGTFIGPNWAIAIHRGTGNKYRANGQHSSRVLADLTPEEFPVGLNVIIDTIEFDSLEEDAPGIFNLYDHPRSSRSDTDFMGISKALYPEFANMTSGYLVKVASGIDVNIRIQADKTIDPSAKRELESKLVSHRYQGYYFHDEKHRQFAVWLHRWNETANFSYISRNGVVSEIFNDWTLSPETAAEFWNNVFRENHPDPDHETRELVKELTALANRSKKVSADEWQKKSKKYWNKFLRFRVAQATAIPVDAPMPPLVPPAQGVAQAF